VASAARHGVFAFSAEGRLRVMDIDGEEISPPRDLTGFLQEHSEPDEEGDEGDLPEEEPGLELEGLLPQAVILSPEGGRIAVVRREGRLLLLNGRTLDTLGRVEHGEYIRAAEFSDDGSVLATAAGAEVRLWRGRDGQPIGSPMSHARNVTILRFSPAGNMLATGTDDLTSGEVRLWDTNSSRPLTGSFAQGRAIADIAFRHDARRLAVGTNSEGFGSVRIWDTCGGAPLGRPLEPERGPAVTDVEYSPNGDVLLVTTEDGTARSWDPETSSMIGPVLPHSDAAMKCGFGPEGHLAFTVSIDGVLEVWDWRTGRPLAMRWEHPGRIVGASFERDGRAVVTACADGSARFAAVSIGSEQVPDWFLDFAECVGGYRLDGAGIARPVPNRAKALPRILDHADEGVWLKFAEWLVEGETSYRELIRSK
jgi:WD40 repeat protein